MELVVKYNKIKKQSPQIEAAWCHRPHHDLTPTTEWLKIEYTIIFQPASSSAERKTHTDPRTNREGSQARNSTHTIFGQAVGQTKFGAFLEKKKYKDKAQNVQKEKKENTLEDLL